MAVHYARQPAAKLVGIRRLVRLVASLIKFALLVASTSTRRPFLGLIGVAPIAVLT